MNNCVLIGRLVREVDLRYLPGGTPTATFTLAVDKNLSKDKKQDMEAEGKATADFIRIVVWNKAAENCANFLNKGKLVGVHGRINTGSYEDKDGKKIYTTDVVANNVEFLEFGDKQQETPEGFHEIDSADIPF